MIIGPLIYTAFGAASGGVESMRTEAQASGNVLDTQLTGLRKQIAEDIKRTFSTFA